MGVGVCWPWEWNCKGCAEDSSCCLHRCSSARATAAQPRCTCPELGRWQWQQKCTSSMCAGSQCRATQLAGKEGGWRGECRWGGGWDERPLGTGCTHEPVAWSPVRASPPCFWLGAERGKLGLEGTASVNQNSIHRYGNCTPMDYEDE